MRWFSKFLKSDNKFDVSWYIMKKYGAEVSVLLGYILHIIQNTDSTVVRCNLDNVKTSCCFNKQQFHNTFKKLSELRYVDIIDSDWNYKIIKILKEL